MSMLINDAKLLVNGFVNEIGNRSGRERTLSPETAFNIHDCLAFRGSIRERRSQVLDNTFVPSRRSLAIP